MKNILVKLLATLILAAASTALAAPTVSLTSPPNNSTYFDPGTLKVSASASEAGGSIARVDFYANGQLIGSATAKPYSISWANIAPGVYSVTATAIDNQGEGLSTTSAARTVTITAQNAPPTVSLTSPPNNSTYFNPGTLNISASANSLETNVRVLEVDFYINGQYFGVATVKPYTVAWTNIAPGTYTITATVLDGLGAVTTSAARTVTVTAQNAPPTVSLTSPPNNSTYFNPVTLNLSANAANPETNGSVAKVDFYANGQLIGTAAAKPYALARGSIVPGTYSITAIATDDLGAATTSAARTLTITEQNAPPTVAISSPGNNARYNGPTADVAVKVTGSAPETNDSIQKVDLYQDGVLVTTLMSAPYTATLAQLPVGSYVLTAVATDGQGLQTTSSAHTVIVEATNRPPSVSLTNPTNATTVPLPGSVTISANASSGEVNGSITQVEFFANDQSVGVVTGTPYSVSWAPAQTGTYSITAQATDNLGAVKTSAARSVTVVTRAPTVTITTPLSAAQYRAPANIGIVARVQDVGADIVQVDFYQGTTVLGTVTAPPYQFVWMNVPAGAYTVSAVATNSVGQTAASTSVPVSVGTGQAQLYYIFDDHLNTPRLITDQSQNAVWSWLPGEAYGSAPPNEDPGNTSNTFACNLRGQGQYFDKETGLFYNYFRDFDPNLGRYSESDLIGLHSGLNTYLYANGNPLIYGDPYGLMAWPVGVPIPPGGAPTPGPVVVPGGGGKPGPSGLPPELDPYQQQPKTFPEIRVPPFPPSSPPPERKSICELLFKVCMQGAQACPMAIQIPGRAFCIASYVLCVTISGAGGSGGDPGTGATP